MCRDVGRCMYVCMVRVTGFESSVVSKSGKE
jgi:hypothetical protein